MAQRSAPAWLVYAACWLPLLGVYTALFVSAGPTPAQALRAALAVLLPPAVLGAPVAFLRLAGPQGAGRRAAEVHLLRALVFAVSATALWIALLACERAAFGMPFRLDPRIALWQLVLYALLYAALAGVAQARRDADLLAANAERLAAADALRARAELQALRSQLNPHFVLNALHTLHALVRRDPARTEQAIEELGRLLQYGLAQQRQDVDEVTLQEEWAFVADYARIERMRFGERLALTLQADEDALACRLPPFSVQPLVENAVVHAVSPRAAGGSVIVEARVEASRSGDLLRVAVLDDGPGPDGHSSNGLGLGLKLIEQRLAALYGPAARLRLEARPEGGTRATLEIPQRVGGEPAETP